MKMKKKPAKKAASKKKGYEPPLAVTGSFMDIMRAAATHANKSSAMLRADPKTKK